jgi:hypothetical protein
VSDVAKIEAFVASARGNKERAGHDSLRFACFERRAGTFRGDDRRHGIFSIHLDDGDKVPGFDAQFEASVKFAADFCGMLRMNAVSEP